MSPIPLPLELKALIVHELAHDPKALSAVSYVWPETIPYIREHRFQNLEIYGFDSLSRFLEIIAGAPAILSGIRSISFTTSYTVTDAPLPTISRYIDLIALVRMAPNLEELSTENTNLAKLNLALSTLPPSPNPKLQTFTIKKSHTSSLTILLNLLSSFPHLTTLHLLDLTFFNLHQIGRKIWDVTIFHSNLHPENCAMWDTLNFKAPTQIPNITSLYIHIETTSHLMFLDLLASPKTPFPKLEEITFADHFLPSCRPVRLPALVHRYKDTLRVLDLQGTSFITQTPILAFPPTLEHFKFALGKTALPDSIIETLSLSCSTTLRNVRINLRGCDGTDTGGLDKVLVGMRGLEQLDLDVWLHMRKTVEDGFSMCLAEGRLRMVWHVEDMKNG